MFSLGNTKCIRFVLMVRDELYVSKFSIQPAAAATGFPEYSATKKLFNENSHPDDSSSRHRIRSLFISRSGILNRVLRPNFSVPLFSAAIIASAIKLLSVAVAFRIKISSFILVATIVLIRFYLFFRSYYKGIQYETQYGKEAYKLAGIFSYDPITQQCC